MNLHDNRIRIRWAGGHVSQVLRLSSERRTAAARVRTTVALTRMTVARIRMIDVRIRAASLDMVMNLYIFCYLHLTRESSRKH